MHVADAGAQRLTRLEKAQQLILIANRDRCVKPSKPRSDTSCSYQTDTFTKN